MTDEKLDSRLASLLKTLPLKNKQPVSARVRYQIAQKLHAVSDPHEPPDFINDRARDVVDLLLLRDLVDATGKPTLAEICQAGLAVFGARAAEATELGRPPRDWPPTIFAHDHWVADYAIAATSGNVGLNLDAATAELNDWITRIAAGG